MKPHKVSIEYPEPLYSLFDTSRGGLPAIVVVNAALAEFAYRDVFPWHLSIILKPQALAQNGMPTEAEYLMLDAIGDIIEETVTGRRNAVFLARETWNGQRQLLFRVHDPEITNCALTQLMEGSSQQRHWEFRMEHDGAWSLACPVLSLVEKASGSDA